MDLTVLFNRDQVVKESRRPDVERTQNVMGEERRSMRFVSPRFAKP
jgi:hypothetical protein